MTKRVLVIGGNGFIGSHLVDALVQQGAHVQAFDRFSSGVPRYRASEVEMRIGEFSSPGDIVRAVHGQDVVVHALSATTPATIVGGARADIEANLLPTLELMERAAATGVGRFVFISSGGTVYGSGGLPAAEHDQLLPISPYGIGKAAIERYLAHFTLERGLDHTVLRVGNPYGLTPRLDLPRFGIVAALFRSIREGDARIGIMGDGSMVRDYITIEDTTRMLARVVLADSPRHAAYNVGSGIGTTVEEIVGLVESVSGVAIRRSTRSRPASYVERIVLDCSRFAEEFPEERPSLPIRDGLERMWARLSGTPVWSGREAEASAGVVR